MTIEDEYPPVSAVSTGMRGRCPRCGVGRLFGGFLSLAQKCDHCGLDYDFADAGDGPAVFVSLIVGTAVVGLALVLDAVYELPVWVNMVVSLTVATLMCLLILRPLKGVLVSLQYRNKAEQGRLE